MSDPATPTISSETKPNMRLALLLSMAMFVLVVDTSLMNVSIAAVTHDLGTTVSVAYSRRSRSRRWSRPRSS